VRISRRGSQLALKYPFFVDKLSKLRAAFRLVADNRLVAG
jgi:hypothetical protein